MTNNRRFFDEFQPHTRLKHAILKAYVIAWAMKLLLRRGAGHRLAIVDAFAGAGRDSAGNDGSPLIAVKKAREAMSALRPRRGGKTDPEIHVFAIERRASLYRALAQTLEPYVRETPDLIHVLRGELMDHIEAIQKVIGGDPAFHFLDPFGISGLDSTTYSRALSGAHNEIFALFSNLGAVRMHALVSAKRANAVDNISEIVRAPSLFPELDEEAIQAAVDEAAKHNKALDLSTPNTKKHLSRALGGSHWERELEGVPAADKADAFLRLFHEALSLAGASEVLTMPMRNEAGHPVYALVHASKSLAGFMTMKAAISEGLARPDWNPTMRDAIKADLSLDVASLVRLLGTAFAGQELEWATRHTGLRDRLLARTPLFPFQATDELKPALIQAGVLRRVGRKEVCRFPALNHVDPLSSTKRPTDPG